MVIAPIATPITTTRFHPLTIREASQPEVRVPAETAEDIADVVLRSDAPLVRTVPLAENASHDGEADVEEVVDGDGESVLVCAGEVLVVGAPWGRTVEV